MDSIFDTNNRQPAPTPIPPVSTFWQGSGVHSHMQDMEFQYSVAPPTHHITSPPTTPMTPGSHGPPFPPLPPPLHGPTGGISFQSSAPALSHSSWPPDYRLYALCQEIQHILTKQNMSDNKIAWEQFCVEYFHEMAVMIIEADFGEGFKRYSLHGSLILWYFKSIVESGVTRFDVILGKIVSHSYQQQIQRIECPEARQELEYELPHQTKVCTHGQLVLEFTMENKPRIISWLFHIQNHVEMIPRFSLQTPAVDLSKNLTCQGLPASTQSVLIQLNVRPNPPQKLVQVESNIWEQPPLLPPPPPPPSHHHQQQHELMSDSSSMLTHLPPTVPPSNNHVTILPPPPPLPPVTNPLSHTLVATPTSPPPLTLSPVMIKSNGSSYGSTCSIVSSGNNTVGGMVMAKVQQSVSNGVGAGSAHSKAGGSPAVVSKRNELVMVASEPALFSADMVHGFDERKITRVDNHTKQVVTSTPPSLSIATPSSTTSDIETTPSNSLTNQNGSLVWMNSTYNWGSGHPPTHPPPSNEQ